MQKSFEGGLQNAARDLERVRGCALQPEGKPGGPEVAPALRAGTKMAESCRGPWVLLAYGVRCVYLVMVLGVGPGAL